VLYPETPVERYDENMRYLTDEEWLKKQGRKDPRGRWHNKETREQRTVNSINETVDETAWTREAPIDNEPYQKFDNKKQKWVVDAEKKEAAEKENELAAKKAEIAAAEQKRLRSVLAIIDNAADAEDLKINEEYKEKILALREEIQTLEKKKSA
jgi:hypothetical protein